MVLTLCEGSGRRTLWGLLDEADHCSVCHQATGVHPDGTTPHHPERNHPDMTAHQMDFFEAPDLADLQNQIKALHERLTAVEARREVRTHSAVVEREQQIIDALAERDVPLTTYVLAVLINQDPKVVEGSCRKLAADGRIVRVTEAGRTPHYTVNR